MGLFTRRDSTASVLPAHAGFAVVDVETTGISPRTNRIVEIAVVNLDADLRPQSEFVTLVNPGRDVGPTSIHGVTASDLVEAPPFAAVAGAVLARVAGRVVVAHNATFDARFLLAEFGRLDVLMPELVTFCTMELSGSYFAHAPSRRLADCCAAAGIEHAGAHDALNDALAAAALLQACARNHSSAPPSWVEALTQAALMPWPALPVRDVSPRTRQSVREARERETPFLARLVRELPRYGIGSRLEPYLAVLDSVIEDRLVTDVEAEQLRELAHDLGLTSEMAVAAHRLYLGQLAVAAVADSVVTDAERADIAAVVRLLGLDPAETAGVLEWAQRAAPTVPAAEAFAKRDESRLHAGDSVVFTGECSMPRAELERLAHDAGLVVRGSVSKRTTLLVIADPHSQSTKARAARDAGVRIVSEQVFLTLATTVDPAPRPRVAAPAAAGA